MGLQDIIIERYFENFPKQSLRGISANTDMQITRVFRILNGSPMKLCEYESFENAIRKNELQKPNTESFLNISIECLRYLSEEKIGEFMQEMNQALKIKKESNCEKFSNNDQYQQLRYAKTSFGGKYITLNDFK